MYNNERIRESSSIRVSLTDSEAEALQALSRALSGKVQTQPDDEDGEERCRIALHPLGGESYELAVYNAVGTIRFGDTQYQVVPKIDWQHFVHLAEMAGYLPDVTTIPSDLAESRDFSELVAGWFVSSLEKATRGELFRDYTPRVDNLRAARGRIDVLPSVRQLFSGSMLLRCKYDDFSLDNPINRLCKAALKSIIASAAPDPILRSRCMRLRHLFDQVGDFRVEDLSAQVDRRTARFESAVRLAKLLLRSLGITLMRANVTASCFLIPTPKVAEDGIRMALRKGLAGITSVGRGRLDLTPARYSVNPDLDFEQAAAIGDVKYKLTDGILSRGDMYQSIAFATAYNREKAIVVSFSEGAYETEQVIFGEVALLHVCWNTMVAPSMAARVIATRVREFLGEAGNSSVGRAS